MSPNHTVRDAPAGQLARLIGLKHFFLYPEEEEGFKLPDPTSTHSSPPATPPEKNERQKAIAAADEGRAEGTFDQAVADGEIRRRPTVTDPQSGKVYTLVTWYDEADPENPHNWSLGKKFFVIGVLCILTFVVYMGAAIVSPGLPLLIAQKGISELVSTFVISLYVLGYGLGPLIFSPLTELPKFGRSIFYIVPLGLYFCLLFASAFTPTFGGLLATRFLTGFVASPALATGAATIIDIVAPEHISYGLAIWVVSAYAGPGLGPVLSAFQTIKSNDFRWTLWTQICFTFVALVLTFFFLPETSEGKILYERAKRLRKATGNDDLRSQGEINQANTSRSDLIREALYRPFEITVKDPSVLYINVFVSLQYGLYYLFFASFPIVFFEIYQMPLNTGNLPYLSIVAGGAIFCTIYILMYRFYVEPLIKAGKAGPPENVLIPGIPTSILACMGLWMFAWTSRTSVNFIVPCIGVALFAGSAFLTLQCIFAYLSMSYPQYAASLFAANDFMRSTLAFCLLIAGTPLFRHLKIPAGVSLCAALLTGITPGYFFLFWFGAKLRARSKFTAKEDVGSESKQSSDASQAEKGPDNPPTCPTASSPSQTTLSPTRTATALRPSSDQNAVQ